MGSRYMYRTSPSAVPRVLDHSFVRTCAAAATGPCVATLHQTDTARGPARVRALDARQLDDSSRAATMRSVGRALASQAVSHELTPGPCSG